MKKELLLVILFMYMEEDMLGIYIKKKKYRMLYSEGLKLDILKEELHKIQMKINIKF